MATEHRIQPETPIIAQSTTFASQHTHIQQSVLMRSIYTIYEQNTHRMKQPYYTLHTLCLSSQCVVVCFGDFERTNATHILMHSLTHSFTLTHSSRRDTFINIIYTRRTTQHIYRVIIMHSLYVVAKAYHINIKYTHRSPSHILPPISLVERARNNNVKLSERENIENPNEQRCRGS